MTIVLLTLSAFLFTVIVLTLILQLVLGTGRRERRDARRRNHVH